MLPLLSLSGGLTANQLSRLLNVSRSRSYQLIDKALRTQIIEKSAIMMGHGRDTNIYTITSIGAREAGSNWTPYKTANSISRCILRAEYLCEYQESSASTFFEKQSIYQISGNSWPFAVKSNGKPGGRDCIITNDGNVAWPVMFDGNDEKELVSVINAVLSTDKEIAILCRKLDLKRIENLLKGRVLSNDSNKLFNVARSRKEWISIHSNSKGNTDLLDSDEAAIRRIISNLPRDDDSIKKALIKNQSLNDKLSIYPVKIGRIKVL
jgi:DNA-binding PadR family transcriptional regulator